MFDPSFDRPSVRAALAAALAGVLFAAAARAQMPGAPVLQNAWATPGLVGAVNVGGGSDGSVYAGAIGFAPGSGRFQLSAGLGALKRSGEASTMAYGVRAAIPFGGASSSFGFGLFAGIGGGGAVTVTTTIPVGGAIGWRKSFGPSHGVSIYATPSYVFVSRDASTGGKSGIFRTSVGADIGITSSIGGTFGAEFGGTLPRGVGGSTGTLYGLGVSYAFGSR